MKLSVIVISFNPPALLERCLDALTRQAIQGDIEIIVVRRIDSEPYSGRRQFPPDVTHPPDATHPPVRWLDAPEDSNIPKIRSLGLEHSRGEVVALIEDDCIVSPGWLAAVIEAHQSPFVAIGGPVEPGPYLKSTDWAIYFCEYGRFMPPFHGEGVQFLPGNNVSYKRELLRNAGIPACKDTGKMPMLHNAGIPACEDTGKMPVLQTGFYDVFFHQSLQKAGYSLKADERLVVRNVNTWSWENLLSVPFHHGKGFAGQRLAGQPRWLRLVYAAGAFFLPFLSTARVARRVAKRYFWELIRALPWVILFNTSWAAGEAAGYLFGVGNSPEKWR